MDDARSFVLLMAGLAGQFRCIAYDLPAGGGDGARLGRYTHADLVADALALLDHLDLRQSYVLGSSFGSTIALGAMRAQPKRLLRGVLQGGFARRRLAPAEVLLARAFRYWPGHVGRVPLRRTFLYRCHAAPFAGRPPELWDYFVTRSNAHRASAGAHRALLIHQIDLRATLSEIRQPVLLICGDNDPLVGPECEKELLNGLPNAGRVRLTGCGHNSLFTHPEVMAEVIRRFLTPP
jgi:pimeloyl-ACP methyl ester carboxylesterase